MPETTTIPAVGKVPKWAVGAGLAGVTVLVIMHYRSKSSTAAAATAAPATAAAGQYPADGTTGNPADPYSTDPATGQTYGDESAGSAGSYGAYSSGISGGGSYPWDGTYGNTSDPYSQDPSTGQTYGNEGASAGSAYGAGGPPFSTDAAWSAWVIQQMTAINPNTDAGALTDALGVYLAGQPVTAAQRTLIFDAQAMGGSPPVAGAGGYPPAVRAAASAGPGHAATVTVPKVTGKSGAAAISALHAAHLRGQLPAGRHGVYTVSSQSPGAGRRVTENTIVELGIAEKKKG